MSDIALKIENLSKQYRLGQVGTGTISHDLNRWWHTVRGKEDPYLKIGESNDRSKKGTSEYVWALKDIDFEVKQGEILGVIGKNGAGKSTLLKLLSKVTAPSTGLIKSRGRIASLLEVGTGFHPEMTGRENIFMNGTIMGMSKNEITSKLDEIVEFSGVERYLDTPTKRYSSGMTVRLGFAIAAHLDPEILIVDEVLAVGDAEFQKKAIGKMKDVSSGEGRTVLFVSHNMGSIKSLCNKGLLLKDGQMVATGEIGSIIDQYQFVYSSSLDGSYECGDTNEEYYIETVKCLNTENIIKSNFSTVEDVKIEISFHLNEIFSDTRLIFHLLTIQEESVFMNAISSEGFKKGINKIEVIIPKYLLNQLEYQIMIHLGRPGVGMLTTPKSYVKFSVENMGGSGSLFTEKWAGLVAPKLEWNKI